MNGHNGLPIICRIRLEINGAYQESVGSVPHDPGSWFRLAYPQTLARLAPPPPAIPYQVLGQPIREHHPHLTEDGKFISDKYPWCPEDFVPLKVTDPMAQSLLWDYAERRSEVDPFFAEDLQKALRRAGYSPSKVNG